MKNQALIIFNPSSGRDDPDEVRRELAEALAAETVWTGEIRETTGAGDATRWAAEAEPDFQRIVAVGGDGTVAEVAEGLLRAGSSLPLGIVPNGTANLLGDVLKVPANRPQALAAALSGDGYSFDVGFLPELDRHFLIGLGIGIPGRMVENADRRAKDRFGFAAYLMAFLEGLGEGRTALIDVDIDGEKLAVPGQSAIVANIGHFEFLGMTFASEVTPHDRKLDLLIIDHSNPGLIIDGIAQIFGADKGSPAGFLHRRARKVSISANPPLSVQVDGEWIGSTPLVVELAARAVHLVAGPEYRRD